MCKIVNVDARATEIVIWFGRDRSLASKAGNSLRLIAYFFSIGPCTQIKVGKGASDFDPFEDQVRTESKSQSPFFATLQQAFILLQGGSVVRVVIAGQWCYMW